jgi:hypothetical protein
VKLFVAVLTDFSVIFRGGESAVCMAFDVMTFGIRCIDLGAASISALPTLLLTLRFALRG